MLKDHHLKKSQKPEDGQANDTLKRITKQGNIKKAKENEE